VGRPGRRQLSQPAHGGVLHKRSSCGDSCCARSAYPRGRSSSSDQHPEALKNAADPTPQPPGWSGSCWAPPPPVPGGSSRCDGSTPPATTRPRPPVLDHPCSTTCARPPVLDHLCSTTCAAYHSTTAPSRPCSTTPSGAVDQQLPARCCDQRRWPHHLEARQTTLTAAYHAHPKRFGLADPCHHRCPPSFGSTSQHSTFALMRLCRPKPGGGC